MPSGRATSESGEILLDRLPVPTSAAGRDSSPVLPPSSRFVRARPPKLYGVLVGGALAALILGFVVRPYIAPDGRIAELTERAAVTDRATADQTKRAEELAEQLASANAATRQVERKLAVAEQAQSELADKAATETRKRKETQGVQQKLAAVVDKASGTLTVEGDEVRLAIPEKVLFKGNDDQLTERGTKLLARIASVLKTELPDRQIYVHGHTDDQPVPSARPPETARPNRGARSGPVAAPPVARFRTNWELSAARALAIIHYFQDVAKLEPTRLVALAFSQYRPASTTIKAQNRRMELVLGPRQAPAAR